MSTQDQSSEKWRTLIPLVRKVIALDHERRANPQSILDCGDKGDLVPWSEIRARFPDAFHAYDSNPVYARLDFERALQHLKETEGLEFSERVTV